MLNFQWDPKITTFPGLYLVSALIFAPLKACSVYNLRLVSVIGSVLNALLIYKIREHVNKDARMVRLAYIKFHDVILTISLFISGHVPLGLGPGKPNPDTHPSDVLLLVSVLH